MMTDIAHQAKTAENLKGNTQPMGRGAQCVFSAGKKATLGNLAQ